MQTKKIASRVRAGTKVQDSHHPSLSPAKKSNGKASAPEMIKAGSAKDLRKGTVVSNGPKVMMPSQADTYSKEPVSDVESD